MKFKKFLAGMLSVILAVTACAVPLPQNLIAQLTASASETIDSASTMTMSIKADKTYFSINEVKAGTAKTKITIYVDKLDPSDMVSYVMACIKPDKGVTVSSIKFVEDRPGLNRKEGNESDEIDWRYMHYSSDEQLMGFYIQSDPLDHLVLEDASRGIITADVTFPKDAKAGKYDIGFQDVSVLSGARAGNGTTIYDYTKAVAANSKCETIVIDPKSYSGEVTLTGSDVKATPGGEVKINLYADTNGVSIKGAEIRVIYDKDKLTLTNMTGGKGFNKLPTINKNEGTYLVADSADITNDPNTPYVTLTFEVSDKAKEGEVYNISYEGTNGSELPMFFVQDENNDSYLKPNISRNSGSVTVVSKDDFYSNGTVDLKGNVALAKLGESVDVNFYADTKGIDLTSITLYVKYDKSILTLTNAAAGEGFEGKAAKPRITPADADGYCSYQFDDTSGIVNNPNKPYMTLTFKSTDSAKLGDYSHFTIRGGNDNTDAKFVFKNADNQLSYLKPKFLGNTGISFKYKSDIAIYGDSITAKPGETATVNIYADSYGVSFCTFSLKAVIGALEIESVTAGDGVLYNKSKTDVYFWENDAAYSLYPYDSIIQSKTLSTNPKEPVLILKLRVPSDAKPGDVYEITYTDATGAELFIVYDDDSIMKPVMTPAKITVSGDAPAVTTVPSTTSTSAATTTTKLLTTATTKPAATTTRPVTTTTRPASVSTSTTATAASTSATTLPVVTNAGSFEWGKDNWNFNNNKDYFSNENYDLDELYLKTLRKNLTNIEWEKANEHIINTRWNGSCYGMSALAVLSKNGIVPYDSFTKGASCLNDLEAPNANFDVNSLINYYHCLQIKESNQQAMIAVSQRSNEENLAEIISILGKGEPVLVGFAKNGWGGHSVMAYDLNYGVWNIGGVRCNGRIGILDPNFSMQFNEEACIYFNSQTGFWVIPAYINGRLSSAHGAYFNQIISDNDVLNCGGYINGSKDEPVVNFYSKLEIADADSESYSVSKGKNESGVFINQAVGIDDIVPDKFYFYSGESEGIDGYLLKDSNAAYRINQKKNIGMDLSMNYENYLLKASVAAGSDIVFDPSGYASINGIATDYGFTIVSNEGYSPTDWYKVQINGENANVMSVQKTDEGYVMKGNNLENVGVRANNDDSIAQCQFCTEYQSVLIYEIDEKTIGIKVDADNDGTYETELFENPAEDDTGKTKVPADASHTIYGDTNLDGAVNIADVVQLNKFLLNKNDNPMSGKSLANADCMKDGYIDSSDSTFLMNYVSMQITEDKLGVQ